MNALKEPSLLDPLPKVYGGARLAVEYMTVENEVSKDHPADVATYLDLANVLSELSNDQFRLLLGSASTRHLAGRLQVLLNEVLP